jgi:hypothetical protein
MLEYVEKVVTGRWDLTVCCLGRCLTPECQEMLEYVEKVVTGRWDLTVCCLGRCLST